MESVAEHYSQGQVYVVWDNLNLHGGPSWRSVQRRWDAFSAKHGGWFHVVHTPLHASWMNQVEVWFCSPAWSKSAAWSIRGAKSFVT